MKGSVELKCSGIITRVRVNVRRNRERLTELTALKPDADGRVRSLEHDVIFRNKRWSCGSFKLLEQSPSELVSK